MLGIAIDAVTLIVLLKAISDDDMGFGQACLIALVASIGTTVLALALVATLGVAGIFVAAVLAAAILGAALSWLVGAEIKRAFAIAELFMLVHIGFAITVTWLLNWLAPLPMLPASASPA